MKDAIEFARQNGIHKVFETSALTGKNVIEIFSCAAKDLYIDWEKKEKENSPQIDHATLKTAKLNDNAKPKKKKKGGCC